MLPPPTTTTTHSGLDGFSHISGETGGDAHVDPNAPLPLRASPESFRHRRLFRSGLASLILSASSPSVLHLPSALRGGCGPGAARVGLRAGSREPAGCAAAS